MFRARSLMLLARIWRAIAPGLTAMGLFHHSNPFYEAGQLAPPPLSGPAPGHPERVHPAQAPRRGARTPDRPGNRH